MNIMKSGFPLLWIIVVGMILAGIWRDSSRTKTYKKNWTAVVVGPIILSASLWIALAIAPPARADVLMGLALVIFCAPILGVGLWLFLGR